VSIVGNVFVHGKPNLRRSSSTHQISLFSKGWRKLHAKANGVVWEIRDSGSPDISGTVNANFSLIEDTSGATVLGSD